MAPASISARLVAAVFRLLLTCYPRQLRAAHAAEMIAAADAEWARSRNPFTFLMWLLTDVLRAHAEERKARSTAVRFPLSLEARRVVFMDIFTKDLRHGTRALVRRPAFTLTAVLTLALGIGATTAVFSVVDTVLLRPLTYPDADRLIVVGHGVPKIASGEWGMSRAGYFYFREHAGSLEDIGAYAGTSLVVTGGAEPERIPAARITWTVLSTLGVNPALGRSFTSEDDLPGAVPVVLLSHGLWSRRYGADPTIVGRRVYLNGSQAEVVGVMPRSFRFPSSQTAAWVPMQFDPTARPINQHTYPGVARLRSGVGVDDARTEMNALVGRFAEEMPTAYGNGFVEDSGFHVIAHSLLDDTVGGVRVLLWIVLAAAALVLVIACANVANLMVLRSEGRRAEVAVRAALGASSGALFRYLLSEAVILAGVGGSFGVFVSWVGVRMLVTVAPAGLPRIEEIGLDPAALAAALATAVVATLTLAGSAVIPGRAGLNVDLKQRRSSSSNRSRTRLRSGLVVTQIAMALVLLAGSGLLFRSFLKLRAVDPGFSYDNVLTLRLSLSPGKYPDDADAQRFFEQVTDRLRDLPGVTAAGIVTGLPLASRAADNANGLADLPDGSELTALIDTKFAGPGYFEAIGMRFVEGRALERRDTEPGNEGAVITRAMAQHYWPGQSALGKRVRPLLRQYPWHTVVGVIDDVRTEEIRRDPEPTVYFPYTDISWARSFALAIRTEGTPADLLPALRREVRNLDPDVPVDAIATMQALLAEHMSRTTLTLVLLAMAATVALLLGAVGVYGVISYAVSQRHLEIGVRMALGARRTQVVTLVLGQTMLLAAVGIGAGLILAIAGTRMMESLLFETQPADPLTLGVVSGGLALVATVAGLIPARRAATVDPLAAFRTD